MAIRDTAAQNAALNGWLGAAKAAGIPASFQLALFDGDPTGGGVELDATGGYARPAVANDGATWPGASGGLTTSASVSLIGTSTYGADANFWALFDAADSVTCWFTGELDAPISEPTDTVTLTVFLGDEA